MVRPAITHAVTIMVTTRRYAPLLCICAAAVVFRHVGSSPMHMHIPNSGAHILPGEHRTPMHWGQRIRTDTCICRRRMVFRGCRTAADRCVASCTAGPRSLEHRRRRNSCRLPTTDSYRHCRSVADMSSRPAGSVSGACARYCAPLWSCSRTRVGC